jgi:hypothetical protein
MIRNSRLAASTNTRIICQNVFKSFTLRMQKTKNSVRVQTQLEQSKQVKSAAHISNAVGGVATSTTGLGQDAG